MSFIYRWCFAGKLSPGHTTVGLIADPSSSFLHTCSAANRRGPSKDDTYWKEINAAMALTNLAQGKDEVQGTTTSCIIQKSSHIAEVKTVKLPLVQRF
jgi:hypothetical protein